MARVDKQIVSARRFALLALTIAFTAGFLVASEVQTWRKISRARELVAYWFICSTLQGDIELLDRTRQGRKAPSTFTHLYTQYMEGKFGIDMPAKGGDPFLVQYYPNRRDRRDSKPALFPELTDLRPWRRKIFSSHLVEANRELTEAEVRRIAASRASLDRASREPRKDRRYEYMRSDPRWAAVAFGMADAEREFGSLTDAPRGNDNKIDILKEYFKFERAVTKSEFKVPLLDVSMSTDLALWSLMGLLLLQCILLLDTVSNMHGAVIQREEPWLLLDFQRGSSAAVAHLWLALILLAPILTAGAHFTYLWVRFASGDGSLKNLVLTGIALAALAALGTSFTWRTVKSLRLARQLIAEAERPQLQQESSEELPEP